MGKYGIFPRYCISTYNAYRFGRENFQEAMKLSRNVDTGVNWRQFKYMAFDVPKSHRSLRRAVFAARYAHTRL